MKTTIASIVLLSIFAGCCVLKQSKTNSITTQSAITSSGSTCHHNGITYKLPKSNSLSIHNNDNLTFKFDNNTISIINNTLSINNKKVCKLSKGDNVVIHQNLEVFVNNNKISH